MRGRFEGVRMEKPQHLPINYWSVYLMMHNNGTLSDAKKRFFLDNKLSKFWQKTDSLPLNYDAGSLVGAFFSPLEFYGKAGTSDNPSPSGATVKKQKEVDDLLKEALKHASNLIYIFQKIQQISPYYPEEIESISVDDLEVPTESFLIKLSHALAEYPNMKVLFQDNMGLIGNQKDTWLDWYFQVNANLKTINSSYSANFTPATADWVNLYIVFFAPELDFQTAKGRIKKSIV